MELNEVKALIEAQGQAWNEFKKVNDEQIKAKADGKAIGDLEAKLDALGKTLDAKSQALDDIAVKLARPSMGGDMKKAEALEAEVKGFNISMRSDAQQKGRQAPSDFDVKTYTDYKSAFFKTMAGVSVSHLSADEQKALSAGSDPDGGYLLPESTQGRTVERMFEQSLMRQICTVQTITTSKIEGVIDNNEADAGWVTELGARNETSTPQVGRYEIEAFEMFAAPRVSQKIIDDAAVNVEAWLAGKVADKMGRVEGAAFWTGTGMGRPRGLTTYTTAATNDDTRAWGTFEHINTGANGAFHTTKLDVIQDLQGAFKDRYLPNAQWVMRREVRTALRKMKEATSDRYLWEPSNQVGQPERLNGYPVRVDQYMPALATGSLSLAFGDFREAYTIVDRMGIRTLRDPYTAKPWIVFYTTKRVGGGALNFEAVKFARFAA